MQKLIAKLLVFLIILKIIIPIGFIGEVFAVSNSWDFVTSSNYTLSDIDTNHIRIENSLVKLPYHLEHLGAVTDTSLDQARRVIVKGDYAFVSAYNTDSIISIDISDKTNPTIVDSIADGDGGMDLDGPIGLAYTGSYLYVAGYRSDNLNIIDISDPTDMSYVGEVADGNTSSQQLNGAKDVQVYGDHLYVTSYADDAFNVFDNSNASSPSYKKNLKDSTKLNGANRAKIDGNYAYVANDRNDSFAIIDLTNQDSLFQNISIVGEVDDGDNGASLDGARGVTFSGNLVYISNNVDDSLEIIDIIDKTSPVHTGSISDGGVVKLNANRSVILYNNFAFNTARSSDAIEVVDISDPTSPTHESQISRVSGTILLNGVNDIYNSGSIFYAAGNVDDSLEILKAKYSDNSPYIIPNNSYNYTGAINSFSETLGANNQGNITYQISYDDGTNWYYYDGSSWQQTSSGTTTSNSASVINSNLYSFNEVNDSGTGSLLFKAFLNSDGTQKVELDKVNITTTESPTDISNPVFWYDGQDTDEDGNSTNEPSAGAEVSPLSDKFNTYDAYSNTVGEIPTYNTGAINNHPNLNYDGTNDHYVIDNQNVINTSDYYEKSFSLVFKTSNDISTFQNIYEQGGTARGYAIQIENGYLYAGVFNNKERASGNQYKFVNLGAITTNTTYYLTMIQESINSKTLKVFLDSNLVGSLSNVDYQRSHGGAIGLGFINGNIVKAADNSSTSGPAYFKGQIGEFLSWNHALADLERQGIDMYLKNKWDLIFKIYPIITTSSISDNEVFSTGTFDFDFTYEDGEGGSGIDTSSSDIELYKWDSGSSSWGTDISGSGVILDSITTSTGSYSTNDLEVGDYKVKFSISNNDGNSAFKEVLFTVDLIGTPGKIFHFDGQNIDGDFDDSNEPSNNSSVATWTDIKNAYNSTQSTAGSRAIYKTNSINSHPSLIFDGTDDYYDIGNQADINTATSYDVKAFSMILKTGNDVSTFQNVYEQGGGTRGYAIQIESGHLYMGTWNNAEWDSGHQYKFVDLGSINTNEIYNILFIQDSTDGTDTGNIIKVYIDGSLAGTLNHVDIQKAHSGDIVLGKNHDGRKYDETSPGDGNYFNGYVGEFISWNYSLTGSEVDTLNEYLRERWNLDKVAPIISSTNFASGSLLPGVNHNLEFTYSDSSEYGTGVLIDTTSGNISLERWDSGSSTWTDESSSIGTGTLSQSGASYPISNLNYGKYKISFSISDNNGNTSNTFENIFYIDKPELIISTGSVNIGTLNDITNTFGDTITVTVKTVGASFNVKLKKNEILTYNSDFIPYYDGSVGMGYDKNDDGSLFDYNNDIIMQEVENINTSGDLNTYTYTLKVGAIINAQQSAGDYTGKINFGIELDY